MSKQISLTMLSSTAIRLFGRPIAGLEELVPAKAQEQGGANPQKQGTQKPPSHASQTPLGKTAEGKGALMALISAFSYEGRYTPLRAPALFLVQEPTYSVKDNGEVDLAQLGLAHLDGSITFASDLK